jgi:hypothetical protein
MDFLQRLNTSPFAFTEPNLQWDKTILQEAKQLQRRCFTHGHLIALESELHMPTSYKPGGTCIGVNGKWTIRVIYSRSGVDPSGQGRWSYITISGRDTPDMMFILAHRVCQKASSKAGPLTSYTQQWTMSHVACNKSPDPRNDFISDLIQFVKEERILKPVAINVNLDANECMGEDAEGLQQLTSELLGLTDINSNQLGALNAPATCLRGKRQINHSLACHLLLPHAKRCGFGAFGDGPITDHRWGQVDLDLAGCFRGRVTAIEHLAGRSLRSKSPKATAKCSRTSAPTSMQPQCIQTDRTPRNHRLQQMDPCQQSRTERNR